MSCQEKSTIKLNSRNVNKGSLKSKHSLLKLLCGIPSCCFLRDNLRSTVWKLSKHEGLAKLFCCGMQLLHYWKINRGDLVALNQMGQLFCYHCWCLTVVFQDRHWGLLVLEDLRDFGYRFHDAVNPIENCIGRGRDSIERTNGSCL